MSAPVSTMRDVQLALRGLIATPVVSIVAVLSLALGIGANTAIFSLVNALLLKNLPVAEPQRLVTVSSDLALGHGYRNGIGWNYEMWQRFEQRSAAFDDGFAWTWKTFDLAAGGPADRVHGMMATGSFFTTLGVSAQIGRTFTPADDVRGGGPDGAVAVISHALWQRRYAGGNVIGSHIDLDRVPFTIVGVTPPGFFGIEVGESLDVVVPLGTDPLLSGARNLLDEPGALLLTVMLRLKPAQSSESATSAIRAMQPSIIDFGRPVPRFLKEPFVLVPAGTGSTDKSQLRQRYEQPLLIIAMVVGLVLSIACVNIANLLIARAAARRQEFSVRLALGASRARLARQLLVESMVLAVLGAMAGLLFGTVASRLLVSQLSPSGDAVFLALALDWRMIAFTAAVAVATALVFGTAPAFLATRVAPFDVLREGRSSGLQAGRVSRGLVIVQVALSLILVCAAGLFLNTFTRLNGVPVGFDADRVMVVTVDASASSATVRDREHLAPILVRAAANAATVVNAAASIATPGPGGGANLMTDARGRAVDMGRRVMMNAVTPGWFSTYGLRLRAGRDFTDGDTATSPPVALVNETFVRELLAGGGALGAEFDDSATDTKRTIVGVVPDMVYGSRRDKPGPQAYIPLNQSSGLGRGLSPATFQVSVRSGGGPMATVIKDVGAVLAVVDPKLSFAVRVVGDSQRAALAQERLVAMLAGFFGVLAAVLTGLGLYGVTAYAVSRRETEIGVRLALGGSPVNIVHLVLSRTVVLVFAGIFIGVMASLWLSQFVSALLYGVTPRSIPNLLMSAGVLLLVAAAAVIVPARRAVCVNPSDLLRRT
jgi:predicted permease